MTEPQPDAKDDAPRSRWKMGCLTLIFVLLLTEGLLQLLTAVSPAAYRTLVPDPVPRSIVDPELGRMPNPDFPDHDDWGFRNESVPDSASIVVLGDSQTYGTGVLRTSAWPSVLADEAKTGVYNISFGGWGQVKQMTMFDKACSLKPDVIIVALYFGNDFFDCYRRVYLSDRHPAHRATDPALIAELEGAEKAAPIYKDADRIIGPGGQTRVKRKMISAARHVRLLGLARRIFDVVRGSRRTELTGDPTDAAWAAIRREAEGHRSEIPFESGRVRTVLTPSRRHLALNEKDPRMVEGCRLALATVEEMSRRAAERGIRFAVILIPTKESSFEELCRESDLPDVYRELVSYEARFRERCLEFLSDRKIPVVDLRPALAAALAAGKFPYSSDGDGHPTPEGHRIIAETSASELRRAGVLK